MSWFRCHGRAAVAALAAAAVLSGCSALSGEKKPPRPCPSIAILGDAGHLTRYSPGPGRDLTDVVGEANIVNFFGECSYDRDSVDVDLNVVISVLRGPAERGRQLEFSYFVAVPSLFPDPAGKRIFPVTVQFPGNLSRISYGDRLRVQLPAGANQPPPDIYIGLQLTEDQLRENRSRRQP